MTVRPCPLPAESALSSLPPAWATWVDAWEAPLSRADRTALDLYRATMAVSPPWLDAALRLRDRIGGLVGIRPVGDFHRPSDPAVPRPGERLGIFTVRAIDDDELLLGDDDVHLDFRMAIRRDLPRRRMVIAMALRTHNLLGRLYMIPVGPIHRRLVARMLARAVARGDV